MTDRDKRQRQTHRQRDVERNSTTKTIVKGNMYEKLILGEYVCKSLGGKPITTDRERDWTYLCAVSHTPRRQTPQYGPFISFVHRTHTSHTI